MFLIGTLDIGGAEGQLVQLLAGMDRKRFSPVVCCLSSASGAYADDIRNLGIEVHEVGFRGLRLTRSPAQVFVEVSRLARLIRAQHPDIVHGFLFWAYVLGAFTARTAGVRTVISSRRSLGTFKARRWHYLLLERVANALTTLVIANSRAVRTDAIQQERLAPKKVVVIYNGVEIRPTEPVPSRIADELRLEEARTVVTVVANFIRYKGHRFFLEAWRTVVLAIPSAVAVLVGDGPERAACEKWVLQHGLARSVRFVGSRRDIPEILAATNIVVHPSLEEGFSNAILEAMAAGRPVIATAVGGNPEAVDDGRTGILVPPRNPERLAAAILGLAAEPDRAHAMGEAGRAKVMRCFSLDQMVSAYQDCYERVASGLAPEVGGRVGPR
jgi:glycosyltransferase involved in cell wall biosynthesis